MSEEKPITETKKRLASYVSLRKEIENRLDKLAYLKNQEKLPGMMEHSESQRTSGTGDRMERAIIRRMEYEERIKPEIASRRRQLAEIDEAIESLDDPMQREILRLRYTESEFCRLMPWKEVALNLFGDNDERHILATYRLHGRALVSISEKFLQKFDSK